MQTKHATCYKNRAIWRGLFLQHKVHTISNSCTKHYPVVQHSLHATATHQIHPFRGKCLIYTSSLYTHFSIDQYCMAILPGSFLFLKMVPRPEGHKMGVKRGRRNGDRSWTADVRVTQLVCQCLDFVRFEIVVIPEDMIVRGATGALRKEKESGCRKRGEMRGERGGGGGGWGEIIWEEEFKFVLYLNAKMTTKVKVKLSWMSNAAVYHSSRWNVITFTTLNII